MDLEVAESSNNPISAPQPDRLTSMKQYHVGTFAGLPPYTDEQKANSNEPKDTSDNDFKTSMNDDDEDDDLPPRRTTEIWHEQPRHLTTKKLSIIDDQFKNYRSGTLPKLSFKGKRRIEGT